MYNIEKRIESLSSFNYPTIGLYKNKSLKYLIDHSLEKINSNHNYNMRQEIKFFIGVLKEIK